MEQLIGSGLRKEYERKKSYDQPRQHIKKQRHYFANKGPSSQGYGFSSGHIWIFVGKVMSQILYAV